MLSTVLIVVGIALLLVAGGMFIFAQVGYKQAQTAYSDLSGQVLKDSEGRDVPTVDFDALRQVNEDIVAWVSIPGTQVNYPVLKGADNDEYLRTLPDGTWNASGSIFMDMDDAAPGMADQQTTLYGHHMNDGSMFTLVDESLGQDAFDAIDTVYYITPESTYVLKPLFTAKVDDVYVDARTPNFEGEQGLTDYLTATLAKAGAQAPDAVDRIATTDRVLTLITCAGIMPQPTERAALVCSLEETLPNE